MGIARFCLSSLLRSTIGLPGIQRRLSRNMSSSSTRTYQDAIEHLNSLQSNAATLEAVRASGGRLSEFAIPEMLEYLERIGYTPYDLNALNVIHITGTKGKGSTSAFVNSILQNSRPSWKIGLYTSPHLVAVRERIRVNGIPISEAEFTKYFFQVWDKLTSNDNRKLATTPLMPGYFRFLTLLAFHTFLEMKVNAAILEVGVGGTYDSTNIVPQPIVTGITALGIDHVAVLGKTLAEIAWQKGGIFKNGVPALTVDQPQEAMDILRKRAEELKSSSFQIIEKSNVLSKIPLGLAGKHQIQNATLAVEIVRTFLKEKDALETPEEVPEAFVAGLANAKWPGRCQTVTDPRANDITWYLDGAHTLESLECCIQWFVTPGVGLTDAQPVSRVLVFNCTSGRSGHAFLGAINSYITRELRTINEHENTLDFFDQVIFCTNVTYADGHFKGDLTTKAIPENDLAQLTTQQQLASTWSSLLPNFPQDHIHVLPSIEHAVTQIKKMNTPTKVLVTGSLHLVGGVIEVAGLAETAL